jgi:pSer/pThr/pTyr-binding forkhead associated (FHA) protein
MRLESLQCHLVYLSGQNAGKSRSFDAARITIGRSSNSDFQFDPYNDLEVASQHAEILLDEDIFFVHDLGTRGGTFVNGERITERHPLRHEDYLQFGKNGPEIIFRKGMAGPDPQPLPPETPDTGELEFLSGWDQGKVFPVLGDRVTRIGRRSDIEISLDARGDMMVSGNHCSISTENNSFVITDTSRNGTYINGAPIDGSAYLNDGDILTLGDGGPRARFTIHPPHRNYPNLSGEFPRLSRQGAAGEVSERKAEQRTAEARQAHPAGSTQDETVDSTETEDSGEVAGIPNESDESLRSSLLEAALKSEPTPQRNPQVNRNPTPAGIKVTPLPARAGERYAAPAKSVLNWIKGHRYLLLAAACFVVVIIGLAYLVTRQPAKKSKAVAEAPAVNYSSLESTYEPVTNTEGHYTVQVPRDWSRRQERSALSLESPDKQISVDYARDAGIDEAFVFSMLGANGAKIKKLNPEKSGAVDLTSYVGTTSDRAYYVVVHKPKDDVPAMAMLETSPQFFGQLPESTINELVISNLKLQQLAPKPTATPKAAVTPRQTVASAPPIQNRQSPAPVATHVAAAVSTPTPASSSQAPPQQMQLVGKKSIGEAIAIPREWSASEDADSGVLDIKTTSGADLRIARDPSKLDPAEVFKAMVDDGWKELKHGMNQPIGGSNLHYHGALMDKDETHLLLILLEQPDTSTLVIYATNNGAEIPTKPLEVARVTRALAEVSRSR